MGETGRRAPRCMLVVATAEVRTRRDAIAAALKAGVDAVQLRDPRASGRELLAAAQALRGLTLASGAALLVNDRLDVARIVAAEGAHLPASSIPIAAARRMLGPAAWIGRSTHSASEARAAAADGADYVVLGPIYATPSKGTYGPPLGPAVITEAGLAVPLVAIGGVTVERVPALRTAGAYGVAVIRAILDASDPGASASALVAALTAPSI